MNYNISKYFMLGAVSLLCSCANFTEIEPKGQNILSTTQELEMILNNDYDCWVTDARVLSGDCIYNESENVIDLLNRSEKTRWSILLSWDEDGHDSQLADLMADDEVYSRCYNRINRIANPILSRVDFVTGSQDQKDLIKCEALLNRAIFHYIAVQKFAKAYDISYAATTPAIPYVLDTDNILEPQPKRSLQYVYEHILADIDLALTINGLPDRAINRMRLNKACAYAAKAMVLMSMQNSDEAAKAARNALDISDVIVDYNTMTTTYNSMLLNLPIEILYRPLLDCEEDYFSLITLEAGNGIPYDAWDFLEEGHAIHEKFLTEHTAWDGLMSPVATSLGMNLVGTWDLTSSWNSIGLKTTYMYLILAENAINNNDYDSAMGYLDKIREKRIDPQKYRPLQGSVSDKAEAIRHLKQTSHGECIFTYYNFVNKKRWSRLDDYKETYKREIGGVTYTLSPESNLWIFPFPQNVTGLNNNITQNY